MDRIECRFDGRGVWAELVAMVGFEVWIGTRIVAHSREAWVALLGGLFAAVLRYILTLTIQRFRKAPIASFDPSGLTCYPANHFSAKSTGWDAVESVRIKKRFGGVSFVIVTLRNRKRPYVLRLVPKGCSLERLVEQSIRWSAMAVLHGDPSRSPDGAPLLYGPAPEGPVGAPFINPAPGWYPDPAGRATSRHWDGVRWTEQVIDGQTGQARSDPL